MKIISASDYGILPDIQIAKQLTRLFCDLKGISEEKTVAFEKGTYFIERSLCEQVYRAITNTTARDEYKNPDEVNMHFVGFFLHNISNLTIDGGGSTFVIDGKMTNMIISECENIIIKNLQIKTDNPNVHKLTVKKSTLFKVDFELEKSSKYKSVNGEFEWYGNGYTLGFRENQNNAFWTGTILPSNKNKLSRTAHPFIMGASKIKELAPNIFRVSYLFHKPFKIGQTFYVFDAHRSDVGIFVEKSKNIILNNVEQNFNYSLAYVAQDCDTLNIESCSFAPENDSELELASLADFIQICMCRGKVTIKNCDFDGSADDALNVHGIHFGISDIRGNQITVSFMHKQSWGFNPLHGGDLIAFINPDTMLTEGENQIVKSEMIDDKNILLTLENPVNKSFKDFVIEDLDRCPELIFKNNSLNRIITRGILYTSRGKAEIENNHFISNTMSAILLSDDAKSWYESGPCKDVTIKDNVFEASFGTPILIKPENRRREGFIHSNINIIGNDFKKYRGTCIKIKSTENVKIKNNKFRCGKPLKTANCTNVLID